MSEQTVPELERDVEVTECRDAGGRFPWQSSRRGGFGAGVVNTSVGQRTVELDVSRPGNIFGLVRHT